MTENTIMDYIKDDAQNALVDLKTRIPIRMVLYGSNDGIPSSGSNSPTECQEEVCSFMVTKHSWKGKYKVFASRTFKIGIADI